MGANQSILKILTWHHACRTPPKKLLANWYYLFHVFWFATVTAIIYLFLSSNNLKLPRSSLVAILTAYNLTNVIFKCSIYVVITLRRRFELCTRKVIAIIYPYTAKLRQQCWTLFVSPVDIHALLNDM